MQPEQQQRILGYFIEEAKEQLNTIEQGLLNLQSTLNDSEAINEVFRAAHSIKGSASMLGLSSIQRTAHRLEDCFKLLKEQPVEVDQKLESLFLDVFDILKALLEHLQGPFGLTEETANGLMSEAQPMFESLQKHLEVLLGQNISGTVTVNDTGSAKVEEVAVSKTSYQFEQLQTQVVRTLRQMLQLFKQTATPETRQSLQESCQHFVELGEELNLSNWCNLCRKAESAIANPENSYLALAKVIITDIKQALELVLAHKDREITISEQLEALQSLPEIELLELPGATEDEVAVSLVELSSDDTIELAEEVNHNNSVIDSTMEGQPVELQPQDSITNFSELFEEVESDDGDDLPASDSSIDPNGPEVGTAELSTLAHLFEGENTEFDAAWVQEDILDFNSSSESQTNISNNNSELEDNDRELADFLSFDEHPLENHHKNNNTTENLSLIQLFADDFPEAENGKDQNQQTAAGELSNISLDGDTINSLEDDSLSAFADEYENSQLQREDSAPELEISLEENNESPFGTEVEQIQLQPSANNVTSSFDELFSKDEKASEPQESNNIPGKDEDSTWEELFVPDVEDTSFSLEDVDKDGDFFNDASSEYIELVLPEEDFHNFWDQEEDDLLKDSTFSNAGDEPSVTNEKIPSQQSLSPETVDMTPELKESASTELEMHLFEALQVDRTPDNLFAEQQEDLFARETSGDTNKQSNTEGIFAESPQSPTDLQDLDSQGNVGDVSPINATVFQDFDLEDFAELDNSQDTNKQSNTEGIFAESPQSQTDLQDLDSQGKVGDVSPINATVFQDFDLEDFAELDNSQDTNKQSNTEGIFAESPQSQTDLQDLDSQGKVGD
nr:Hpt domain-containing protein [Nostocaceae cyanobacterium]